MEITLAQIAVRIHGSLHGGDADALVTGIAGFDTVQEGQLTFITQERYLREAEASPALAIIAPLSITQSSKPLICVDDPRAAFATVLGLFDWRQAAIPGIDLTASIAPSAAIHARAHIGPFVVVGEGAVIGEDCVIHAHAYIGNHVELGAGTVLYPHVTIYPHCTVGQRCILHAGVVIGADGHGYQPGAEGWQKIPHLGSVRIDNDVEIGANTTIDRATTGTTIIGEGCKIDNLVMIAHNVTLGRHCMILGLAGIAGSCEIEDQVIIAGQVGLRDHVRVGAGARLIARAGITKDIPAGSTISGYPGQNHAEEMKYQAMLHRVPDMIQTVKELQQQLARLQTRINELEESSSE